MIPENTRFQLKTAKNYPKAPVIPAKAGIQCPNPKKVNIYIYPAACLRHDVVKSHGCCSVKLLLDTHALLWWWTNDKQLSPTARNAILDERNTVLVSAASVWEIATKYRLGKLPIADKAIKQFHTLVEADSFEHLPMTWQHSLLAGSYNSDHRDPFDRMLAAQSEIEKASLVTCDAAIAGFATSVLW